jgi:hypothetical protein
LSNNFQPWSSPSRLHITQLVPPYLGDEAIVVAEDLLPVAEHLSVAGATPLQTVAVDLTSTLMPLLPTGLFVNIVVGLATPLPDATKGWKQSNLPTHISNHSSPTSKLHMPITPLLPYQLRVIGIQIPGLLIM